MDQRTRETYLETQINTATPQKLHLMLIEGALRFSREAVRHSQEEKDAEAAEAAGRCRRVLSELLAGIRADESNTAEKVAAVYTYLYQTITEIQLHHQWDNLFDVIRVLEVERETWAKVCEQMPEAPDPGESKTIAEVTTGHVESIAPIAYPGMSSNDLAVSASDAGLGGFTLEA